MLPGSWTLHIIGTYLKLPSAIDSSKSAFVAASPHYLRFHKDKEGHKRKRTSWSDVIQKKQAKQLLQ